MSTDSLDAASVHPAYVDLVDDAAIFPPGDASLPDALRAYAGRRSPMADLVGSFVVRDLDLPGVLDAGVPLSVVSTGGAGAIAGPLRLASRAGARVVGLEIALRDPDDLAGSARRVVTAVDAARDDGLLGEDDPVYVELPPMGTTGAWLAAADLVAERELRLKLRTGGVTADAFPASSTLARWMDAALDRETPYKCTAGLHHAVAHVDPATGFAHHGFLNVLLATRLAFDGAGHEAVVAVLDERDPATLAEQAADQDLVGARRWFTSFGSCAVDEAWDDLVALGLALSLAPASSAAATQP